MSAEAAPVLDDAPILLREDADGVTTLTLNRPKQYNALSEEMLSELLAALGGIAADDSVRVVVLAAQGKAFCAGHDLKQMRATPRKDYYQRLFGLCSDFMLTVTALPQPVIARVQGIATAAGCQLVATCDLAVAAEEARFATSGINAGLFCSTPAVALSRNLAAKPAFEMLVTGDFIDAETARALGLINRVVPAGQLDNEIAGLAGKIKGKSAAAIRIGKRLFYEQLEATRRDAYALAAETMACNMMTEDAGEGIDAFIEKRPAVWKHR